MITKILKRAYEKKELISITTKDIEWDQSIIGYITTIDETFFTINEIDEYGKFDGNSVYDLNDVLCVF
ncbi:MAG: hypothetical protein KUL76_04725 [Kaistella sp.]|nr:hypothetical protein [Kaistella sp.]